LVGWSGRGDGEVAAPVAARIEKIRSDRENGGRREAKEESARAARDENASNTSTLPSPSRLNSLIIHARLPNLNEQRLS